MRLVVGLGNPGEKYQNTRHNVGFMVADELAENKRWSKSKSGLLEYVWKKSEIQEVELIRPLTYMNRSGEAVIYAVKKHTGLKPKNVWVIHDDLDIKIGDYKIQKARGPKDHGGLNSIEEHLKTKDFWRVRVGVENRDPENRIAGEEYVLQNFTKAEFDILHEVTKKVISDIKDKIF